MIAVAFQTSGDKRNYAINCIKKSNHTQEKIKLEHNHTQYKKQSPDGVNINHLHV